MSTSEKLQHMMDQGVDIPAPDSVYVAPEVDPTHIGHGTTLFPGTCLYGRETAVGANCRLGVDGPVTLRDSQLGNAVEIASGTIQGSTLLDGVYIGPNAQLRAACLLEEQASCAHAVGLKQTLLMPYVALGSLINFCDCLMAGGTSRKNHSEIGSSFIHFNYTPHQDKATASLIGDVPRGVLLNRPPIFLGGQGGLVGPVYIEYGTITAAGTICRHDVTEPGQLVYGTVVRKHGQVPYNPGERKDVNRILKHSLTFIGNLHALRDWYTHVRSRSLDPILHAGALRRLTAMIDERIHRLGAVAQQLRAAPTHNSHRALVAAWPALSDRLEEGPDLTTCEARSRFLEQLDTDSDYLDTLAQFDANASSLVTAWLQSIVDSVTALC